MEVYYNIFSLEVTKLIWNRFHDIRAGMAYREPKPRHEQLHVFVGLLSVLQYALGGIPALCDVGGIQRYRRSISGERSGYQRKGWEGVSHYERNVERGFN